MKTTYFRTLAASTTLGLMLIASSARGWHFTYSQIDAVGYGYFGGVWPDGRFQTNLIVIPANSATNLSMGSYWGFSTNELQFDLQSNSLSGHHAFEQATGGRGRGVARGGLFLRSIIFAPVAQPAETEDTALPFRLTIRTGPPPGPAGFYASADVRLSIDERLSGGNVVSVLLTSTGLTESTNELALKLGRSYELTCSMTARAGNNNGELPSGHSGTNSFSLEPSVMVSIVMSQVQTRLCVKGWPERRYALERSSDLSAWQPLMTNSAPSGSFEYVDQTAANAPSRFYRAVEQP